MRSPSARVARALMSILPIAALMLAAHAVTSQAARRDDVDDDAEERAFVARLSFENNCLICHSAEMTTRQRLTPAQWKTEVEKMVGWGAPVPSEEVPLLIRYLTEQYPTGKPADPPARISPDEALAVNQPRPEPSKFPRADPSRGEPLFATHCANCHGPTGLGGDLGPNLVEKPILWRDAELLAVLRDGRRRMPGYRAVLKPEQEAEVVGWLKGRRE